MSSGVLRGISLLLFLMPCFTVPSRSDNLTNLLIEQLMGWLADLRWANVSFFRSKCAVKGGPGIDADAL